MSEPNKTSNDIEMPPEKGGTSPDDDHDQLLEALVPPITGSEKFRDVLLRFLDSALVQYLGIFVLLLVVIDGAFFFFLLIGAQTMCHDPSRTNCQPRNAWYNISIQVLCGLFTYMAIVSMPYRAAQFLHVTGWSCPKRSNEIGCNMYGIPNDPDIWCYIPLNRRLGILIVLILNCVTQYINQVTRFVYYDFESSESFPGNVWVNVFFVASFLCAAIGAGWTFYEQGRIRAARPGQFGPGPIDSLKQLVADRRAGKDDDDDSRGSARRHPDPTRAQSRASVLGAGEGRASLRLFAL